MTKWHRPAGSASRASFGVAIAPTPWERSDNALARPWWSPRTTAVRAECDLATGATSSIQSLVSRSRHLHPAGRATVRSAYEQAKSNQRGHLSPFNESRREQ